MRIRSVKPEFWEDETIGSISRDARLLFIATWSAADDEGLLRWNAEYLKATAFPYDDDLPAEAVLKLMHELHSSGLIWPYRAGRTQQPLAFILKFRRHQRVNRPQPSRLTPPSLQEPETVLMYARRDDFVCGVCGDPMNEQILKSEAVFTDHENDPTIRVLRPAGRYPSHIVAIHRRCQQVRGQPPAISEPLTESLSEQVPEDGSEPVTDPGHERLREQVPESVTEPLSESFTDGSGSGSGREQGMEQGDPLPLPSPSAEAGAPASPTQGPTNPRALGTNPRAEGTNPRAVRARDPLFDALALAEGSDPYGMTRRGLRAVGVALAEIKGATPAVTVGEIVSRARNWPTHFGTATCTASAIAKHWARLANPGESPNGRPVRDPAAEIMERARERARTEALEDPEHVT